MPEAVDFSCALPGRGVVLRSVTFSVGPGITAVVGRSGAGSTTLLRAVAGRLPLGSATRGSLRVGSSDVTALIPGEVAPMVRWVSPHRPSPDTVAGHLGRWLDGPQEREVADHLGLGDCLDRPLASLPPDVRALLCLAELRHSPAAPVWCLDQLLGAADGPTRDLLTAEARRITGAGTAVLWADHALDPLWAVADDVLELDRGAVAAHSPVHRWRPRSVPEPLLMTLGRVAGLGPDQHRPPEELAPVLATSTPAGPPTRTGRRGAGRVHRVPMSDLLLEGDDVLEVRSDEALGIICTDARAEPIARRLVRRLRGVRLPSSLPSGTTPTELLRSWSRGGDVVPDAVLAHPGAAGLRADVALSQHGSGDRAGLRVAIMAADRRPLWVPHPQLDLDPVRRRVLQDELRGPHPAPRILTSRDLDLLVSACHRLLVVQDSRVVAHSSPTRVLPHLREQPLLARATAGRATHLGDLIPPTLRRALL